MTRGQAFDFKSALAQRVAAGGVTPSLSLAEDLSEAGYQDLARGVAGSDRDALAHAGVPERILREMFAEGRQRAFAVWTPEHSVETGRRVGRGESLYLWGERGAGKSHVAACGAFAVRRKRGLSFDDVLWAEWPLTLDRLRDDVRSESTDHLLTRLREVSLLVLDDVGATFRPTPFAVDALNTVVRDRYNRCAQTVTTANVPPDRLSADLQAAGFAASAVEPLLSRLAGAGGPGSIVELSGSARRAAR